MNAMNAISALLGQTNPAATTKGDGAKGGPAGVLNMGSTPQNGDAQNGANMGALFQAMLSAETGQAQASSIVSALNANGTVINTGQPSVQTKILEAQSAASLTAQEHQDHAGDGAQALAGAALILPSHAADAATSATAGVIIANGAVSTATDTAEGANSTAAATHHSDVGPITAGIARQNSASSPSSHNHSKAQAITSPTTPHKTVGTDNDVMVGSLGDQSSIDPSGKLGGMGDTKSVPSAVALTPETSFSQAGNANPSDKVEPTVIASADTKAVAKSNTPSPAPTQQAMNNVDMAATSQPKAALHEAQMLASESPRALLNAAEARVAETADSKAAGHTTPQAGQNAQSSAVTGGQTNGQNGAHTGGQNANTGQDAQRLMAQMSKSDGKVDNSAASKPVESFEDLLKTPASQSISSGLSSEVRQTQLHHVSMTANSPLTRAAAAVQNLGLQIGKSVSDGDTKFTIRMDPPSLGRIDVKMEMMADGKMRAYLSVEHRETMNLLQRDSATLERTLQDAGLKMDQNSLNFSLKQQGEQAGNEFKSASNGSGHESDSGFDVNLSNDDVSEIIMQQVITDSAVDIRI